MGKKVDNYYLSLVESRQLNSDGSPRTLAEREDDELMLLTRGGVEAAFEQLVQRHQLAVLNFADKFFNNPDLSIEAAQECFTDLFRASQHYKAQGKFKPFLYRVLLNRCRLLYRSVKSQTRWYNPHPLTPEIPNAEDLIIAQERRIEVNRALAKLSKKLREVLALRFGSDLSYREIAEVLDIPMGTVKRRLYDGIEKLRQVMQEGKS